MSKDLTSKQFNTLEQEKIRNIAVIAHVDHGKTTLIDAFLKQTHLFRENQKEMATTQILDSLELEREKGITIKAKNVSIRYKNYKINIVDTPGHADFSGEVERVLNMVDGCLLIVDAQEGPMLQTRFVLKKAFEMKLKPIVVINKIDKKLADPQKTLDKINDLFLSMAESSEQLDFCTLYAIGRHGKVFSKIPAGDLTKPETIPGDITILLDKIIELIPSPKGSEDVPFQMQVSAFELDEHYGKFLVGTIKQGGVKVGDSIVLVCDDKDNNIKKSGIVKNIRVREGLQFVEIQAASVGEVVAIAGIDSTDIGATLCDSSHINPLPKIKITPPCVKISFEENTSPLVGKDGSLITIKQIEQRLLQEKRVNIGLEIIKNDIGGYDVAGRGELQLAIFIETLRREGYEFQIQKPKVIFIKKDNIVMEPQEQLVITVPEKYIGTVTAEVSGRNGKLENLEIEHKHAKFSYTILTRNFLGLRNKLTKATKGTVVIQNFFIKHVPLTKHLETKRNGVLVALIDGAASAYALNSAQKRGDLFITPGTLVYEGMIVGINKYKRDLEVDVTRERHKSAHRIKHDEITQSILRPSMEISLDFALSFLGADEILEVTPNYLRLRKIHLTHNQRNWAKRKNLSQLAKVQLGKSR